MTRRILQFAHTLKKHLQPLHIPVYHQDETLSSFSAKERMLTSPRYNFRVDERFIDEVAATIILEDFINRPQREKMLQDP